jgi:hypothetical protein
MINIDNFKYGIIAYAPSTTWKVFGNHICETSVAITGAFRIQKNATGIERLSQNVGTKLLLYTV